MSTSLNIQHTFSIYFAAKIDTGKKLFIFVSLDEYEQVLLSLASIKHFFHRWRLKLSLLGTDTDDLFLFTNFATLFTFASKSPEKGEQQQQQQRSKVGKKSKTPA